jgi:heme exporter protein D
MNEYRSTIEAIDRLIDALFTAWLITLITVIVIWITVLWNDKPYLIHLNNKQNKRRNKWK